MTDTRLMEDAEARRIARTAFEYPVILRAGAGTGKTAALVARIVAWTIGPGWDKAKAGLEPVDRDPERVARRSLSGVVAITFTEAAAAEMAERVATAFHAISSGCAVIGLPVEELPPEAHMRARVLLGNIDMLEVRTIHAWCRSLLAQHPLEAGIHPNFVVDADGTETASVIREVVETGLNDILSSSPSPPLFYLLGEGRQPSDIEAATAALVGAEDDAIRRTLNLFGSEEFVEYRSNVVAEVQNVLGLIDGIFEGVRAPNAAKLIVGLGALEKVLPDCETFDDLRTQLQVHLPDSLLRHLQKAWVRGEGGKAESAALATIADKLAPHAAMLSLIFDELNGIDPTGFSSAAHIVEPLVVEAKQTLRAKGIVSFGDLLRLACHLLQRPGVVARVRRGMDQLLVDEFQDTDQMQCGIVRALACQGPLDDRPGLFIVGDPKQSIYGWRNADLQAYDSFIEALKGEGGKEFRLIQNFRSVGGILEEVDRCMEGLMVPKPGVQPRYEALVAARGPGPATGAVEAWVTNAWVEGEPNPKTSATEARAIEAHALAAEMRTLMDQGEDLSQVGVLFRSMSNVDVYQRALRDFGVPYEVTRDQQYFRRVEVIEAAAMIRSIIDAADVLALLTFLRSSMVMTPDAAILNLWCEQFPEMWFKMDGSETSISNTKKAIGAAQAAMTGGTEVASVSLNSQKWAEHLSHIVEEVGMLRGLMREISPDRWLHRVRMAFWPDLVGAMAYQGAYRVANLEQFFRRVATHMHDNRGDWTSLSRVLREAIEEQQAAEEARPSEGGQSVQLMTIHKSKGLAFRHTFIVDMHHRIRGRDRPSGTIHDSQNGVQLLGYWPPYFHRAWQRVERIAAAERIRLLYVAMTRARDRLVLVGAWPQALREGARPRMALDLLSHRNPALPSPWDLHADVDGDNSVLHQDITWRFVGGSKQELVSTRAHSNVSAQSCRLVPPDRRSKAAHIESVSWTQAPSALKNTQVGRGGADLSRKEAIGVGNAIHWLLEHSRNRETGKVEIGREQWERAVRSVWPDEPPSDAAVNRAEELFEGLQSGRLLTWMNSVEILGQELPMLLEGDTDGPVAGWVGSIDLLYRDPDTNSVVVADFKTDRLGDRSPQSVALQHQGQGSIYVRAVQRALRLEAAPRFEVWFIDGNHRVTVPM